MLGMGICFGVMTVLGLEVVTAQHCVCTEAIELHASKWLL